MKFSFLFSGLLFGCAAAQNAVEVAVGAPDLFSTLVDLVVTAGLDEALSTAQDITVFAPTNGAFGKLHEGSLNLLKSEQWRPHLQNLLSYHVLPVKIFSSAITDGLTAATLTGEEVKLNLPASGGVLVNGHSNVVQADGIADNAAIHAVDSVLFPEWVYNSIVNRAISDPELSTLTKLISGLHLTGALSQHGPFTVFAPTDDAFLEGLNALGASDGKLDAGLASKILTYHVVHGIYSAADITDGLELTTANGETIRFSVNEGAPQVNGENIIGADILANNGIVHKIDGLLIPESVAPAPEAPEEPQTVVDIAVSNSDTFSTLVDFAVAAGLVDALSTTQGITVFAPTNDAFAALASAAPGVVANLQTSLWQPHLKNVLLYHVLSSEVPSSAVTNGLTATALNGEDLAFTVNGDEIFVNTNSQVILADVQGSNGVVHAIDTVLIPSWVGNSIADLAIATPDLSTLVDLVVKAGLVDTLSGPGPFTVFAPTNDAFVEFLGDTDPASLDIDTVTSVLTYHVVPGIVAASDIVNGATLTTVQGEELTFTLMGDAAMVNGETIVSTDILANNGIVHVIDGVLIPTEAAPETDAPVAPQTVVDIAVSNADTFSTLVDFVIAADLVDALSTTQGITVFAPTNDAFAALASAAPGVVANLQTSLWQPHLKNVLLYHVLSSEVPSSAVTNGLTATALNGEDLAFTVNGDEIFVNTNSQVILADVQGSNGVVHAIDTVLIPSWVGNSIVDLAVATPDLSTLVDLVVQAGLVDVLAGAGPFTVFAPVNAAFVEFLGGVADPASLDQDLVSAILTYHVVPGIVAASDIVNGATLTTVQGEELTFTLMGDAAMVNGETIVSTDILANNGIVHVIGGVLLPSAATASVVLQESLAEPPAKNTLSLMGSEQESSGHRATAAFASALVSFGALMGMVF